jgi:hypothetical protein
LVTPADLTAILAVVASPAVSVGTTVYLQKRKDRRAAAATSEVSWEAINKELVRQVNAGTVALKTAKDEFDKTLKQLVETHNGEKAALTDQLMACKRKCDDLYRDLYEARRSPPSL